MKKILAWIDQYLLTVLTAILIVVIPLYPKLPLADLIEGYIVRLRLEDILIALTVFVYIVQLLRKKLTLPTNWPAKLIGIYILVGLFSSLAAIFVTHTITMDRAQLTKLALHFGRRVEYFSLFFIAYSGIRTKRDLKIFIATAASSLFGVLVYGFGQKYLYWPAFSTMNREFSKGVRLYLASGSRLMSTFGGHYDYAAYLMMALTALVPVIWLAKKWYFRLIAAVLALFSYWSLLLTASRTSYGGYVIGVTAVALMLWKIRGFRFIVGKYLSVMFVSLVLMLTVGDLSERFLQVFSSASEIHKYIPFVSTGKIEEYMFRVKDVVWTLENLKTVTTSPSSTPPPNAIAVNDLESVTVASDQPPKILPPDVTPEEDALRQKLATESATATPSAKTDGGYSPNAVKYGLSVAIRLDALWPNAVKGFMSDPLLGSGYSTLNKTNVDDFTEAESTDNDYLRMLGETGILGTLSFLAIPLYLLVLSVKKLLSPHDTFTELVSLALIGSIVALFVNATYIDIFESSKVAYTLWILAAVGMKTLEWSHQKKVNS